MIKVHFTQSFTFCKGRTVGKSKGNCTYQHNSFVLPTISLISVLATIPF